MVILLTSVNRAEVDCCVVDLVVWGQCSNSVQPGYSTGRERTVYYYLHQFSLFHYKVREPSQQDVKIKMALLKKSGSTVRCSPALAFSLIGFAAVLFIYFQTKVVRNATPPTDEVLASASSSRNTTDAGTSASPEADADGSLTLILATAMELCPRRRSWWSHPIRLSLIATIILLQKGMWYSILVLEWETS